MNSVGYKSFIKQIVYRLLKIVNHFIYYSLNDGIKGFVSVLLSRILDIYKNVRCIYYSFLVLRLFYVRVN